MRTAQEVCDAVTADQQAVFNLTEIVNLVEDREHWKKRAMKSEKIRREGRELGEYQEFKGVSGRANMMVGTQTQGVNNE